MPGGDQRLDRACRGGISQGGGAAAPDELHGLGRELHAADAALAELHVVAGDALHRVGAVGQGGGVVVVHAALHGADVGHGGEIQVAAPDEGADFAQEALAQGPVAGHRARLDHGGAFPVLAHALVVGQGGGQGDGGRGGPRVRPQTQVGAENIAVGVPRLHKGAHIPRHAREHRAQPVCVGGVADWVVDQDEVDIAGIVQLARAQLAHAEHHQAALRQHAAAAGQLQCAAGGRGKQGKGDAGVQGGFGQGGQCLGDLLQGPYAADVGQCRGECHAPLGLAQGGGQRGPVRVRRAARHGAQGGGGDRVRPVPPQAAQHGGLPQSQVRQIGAVAAQRLQHGGKGRVAGQAGLGRTQGGEPLGQARGGCGVGGGRARLRRAGGACGRLRCGAPPGQPVLGLRRATGRVLSSVLAVAFGLVMLVFAGAAGLVWRLSEAPLDLTWLVPRVAPAGWAAGRVTLQIVPEGDGHDLRLEVTGGELRAAGGRPSPSARPRPIWRWHPC